MRGHHCFRLGLNDVSRIRDHSSVCIINGSTALATNVTNLYVSGKWP